MYMYIHVYKNVHLALRTIYLSHINSVSNVYEGFIIPYSTVVVIGFEKSAYVVFEGERTEVCVAILDRQLTNDEVRQFSVATTQLTDYAATGM